jgi:hypothetical protein
MVAWDKWGMNKEAAEIEKLRAETDKLTLEARAIERQEDENRKTIDYAKWIAIIGGLVTAIATGAGIYLEIRKEFQFRITKELLTVVDNLQSDELPKASAAAYQLAAFGDEVAPYLARRVGTAHPELEDSIVAAFRHLIEADHGSAAVADALATAARDALNREVGALSDPERKADRQVLSRYISVVNRVSALPTFDEAYRGELDGVLDDYGHEILDYGFSESEKKDFMKKLCGDSYDDCRHAKTS